MADIDSMKSLETWLRDNGIDYSCWPQKLPKKKSVADLLQEINNGECYLEEDPPRRVVPGAVKVLVVWNGRQLVEIKQQDQGETEALLTEKMFPGEIPEQACRRGIMEELTVLDEQIGQIQLLSGPDHQTQDSASYPGLMSDYAFFTLSAVVKDLPQEDFETVEANMKIHRWRWKDTTVF